MLQEANELGLLESTKLEELWRNEIRQHALDSLLSIADQFAAAGIEPISEEEVVAEVRAFRAAQHATAIVSGDKDLLILNSHQNIPILRPRETLQRIIFRSGFP